MLLAPDDDYPPYNFGTAVNNGDGTFAAVVVQPVGSCGQGSIDAFDLDGDGDRDVVLTEEQGCPGVPQPRIFVFRNDGNMAFVPRRHPGLERRFPPRHGGRGHERRRPSRPGDRARHGHGRLSEQRRLLVRTAGDQQHQPLQVHAGGLQQRRQAGRRDDPGPDRGLRGRCRHGARAGRRQLRSRPDPARLEHGRVPPHQRRSRRRRLRRRRPRRPAERSTTPRTTSRSS